MRHRADDQFWRAYEALDKEVRSKADRAFELLKQNPRHPSLHFKKISERWSVRVGLGYRALAIEDDDGLVWYWIGSHAEYDRLIR